MIASPRFIFPAAFVLLAALSAPRVAHADALPADACDVGKSAGDACEVGSPAVAGTCKERQCSHALPPSDGGPSSTTYDCLRCEPNGAADADAGADAGAEADDGKATESSSSSDDGGCSTSGRVRDAGPWVLALGVALGVSATRRRKPADRA